MWLKAVMFVKSVPWSLMESPSALLTEEVIVHFQAWCAQFTSHFVGHSQSGGLVKSYVSFSHSVLVYVWVHYGRMNEQINIIYFNLVFVVSQKSIWSRKATFNLPHLYEIWERSYFFTLWCYSSIILMQFLNKCFINIHVMAFSKWYS